MNFGNISLSHVAISCSSLEDSISFYTETLGFKVNESLGRNRGNIKIDLGSATYLELCPFEMYKSSNQGSIAHFAINVFSLEKTIKYLSSKGVPIIRGPFEIKNPDCFRISRIVAFISGPDGEEIEIVQNNVT